MLTLCESWHTNRGKLLTDYFLSARVFLPKASVRCKKLSNQKPTANTVRNTRRTTLRWTNICLSKLLCICPNLFSKKISTKHDIASTKNSYQFLVPKVPVLRRNRATNSSTSNDPFSAATKAQVLGNLSKLVRFAIIFARAVCHWE